MIRQATAAICDDDPARSRSGTALASRGVSRFAPTALVLALLAATAAAFVFAQRVKLAPPPITKTRVTPIFSPTCDCRTSLAYIQFRLRESDAVTALIIDADGDPVRRLATHDRRPRGATRFIWDGRGEDGAVLANGLYRARVRLDRLDRTFDLPNRIRLDATPPTITLVSAKPRTFSPDGDGRSDKVAIRYRVDEPAFASLYVDGIRRVRVRGARLTRKFDWYGRIGGRTTPRRYRLALVARDLAGNVSAPTQTFTVRLRFVDLRPRRILVRAGTRFPIGVDTDARTVAWRLGDRRGVSRPRPFAVRAPERAGVYALFVRAGSHVARARVVVQPRG